MEEKMDSDQSYSDESSSSSDSSSGSSEGDDEVMESVHLLGDTLELPRGLCEDYSVFKEFFSMKTWDSLEEKHKEELLSLLPTFSENDEEEKEETIKMLFNHEPFYFTSPVGEFFNHLKHGNFGEDYVKMRKVLIRAANKQQKMKRKAYYSKLVPDMIVSRDRLLASVIAAPPGPPPCVFPLPPKPSEKTRFKPVYLRARQRYFEELAAIRSEVGGVESDDDNYPGGPPERYIKKRKHMTPAQNAESVSGTLGGSEQSLPTSLECLKKVLSVHRARRLRDENDPVLNVNGITMEDIKQRVAVVNGTKKLMFGGQKSGMPVQKLKRGPKKESGGKQTKAQEAKALKKLKEEQMDCTDNKPLLPNIKIKCEQEESDSESSSNVDPVTSPKIAKKSIDSANIKRESVDAKYSSNLSNLSYSDTEIKIKQEPPDCMMTMQNSCRNNQPVPIKLEDLDGLDMMALPVELADETGGVIEVDTSTEGGPERVEAGLVGVGVEAEEALTESVHASFLSLVRALFPARAAHRASKAQLHARAAAVLASPIAPLNTWYHLCDDWCGELDSALDFLAGERGPHPDDFVPYLQYMPETQMYQWIGAGRDCDAILGRLCERWLRAASPVAQSCEPPPPRYPTMWVVRTPTNSEIAEFRAQERRRFSSAAKPFTYIQHGYRAVVGPCVRAGYVGGGAGGAGSVGAALLAGERPRHAIFATLVRDALARLPNGEGTRHDLLTLLKMSQWIAPCSDQALLSAISSTLDKLHSVKRDPIVRYDLRTAVWTYLHRNRSEEDWLKLSGRARGGKAALPPAAPARPATPPRSPSPRAPSPPAHHLPKPALRDPGATNTPPHTMELEVGNVEEIVEASDSDVDVDDSNVPSLGPQLSSAQLLMQATQQTKQTPVHLPPKPKGKLVATPPQKPKTAVKQGISKQVGLKGTLMTQSVKQANLMAQSIKQATLMTQAKSAAQVKTVLHPAKSTLPSQSGKQETTQGKQIAPQVAKQPPPQVRPTSVAKPMPSPKQCTVTAIPKSVVTQPQITLNVAASVSQASAQMAKSLPSLVTTPQKSPLLKQRPLQKSETQIVLPSPVHSQPTAVIHPPVTTPTAAQNINKVVQGTRSLLIRPPTVQTTSSASSNNTTPQVTPTSRRGVVRVLSPATPSSGKSLISPRALMQSSTPAPKKRTATPTTTSVTTIAQSVPSVGTVVSSVATAVTSSVSTRTVQLAGGRTVQLAGGQAVHLPGGQAVHLPGGQAVQLTPGHTLQLSSLQLPTHSVRLPSGQTVQLASSQTVQAVKMSTTAVKTPSPRALQTSATVKNIQTNSQPTVQIPVSTVQLAGQTVHIGGQTVQLAGQSVQLTGHTVKLPSGQSVQVASQSVMPSQSVQLPSGQTVQLSSGNVQTVQLSGSNVQISGQSVQMSGGQSVQLGSQTVQLGGQTVQLAGGQTVQLPSGQTLQLSSGQTVQLSSGQTLQLASGQTVHLANQGAKSISQVIRSQTPVEKSSSQPIVAKLLTNSQGQMISLEGMVSGTAGVSGAGVPGVSNVSGVSAVSGVSGVSGVCGGVRARGAVRVLAPSRLSRPLLLTAAKPLHNIILQQSDGSAIRVTSSGGSSSSQTLVLSNIGGQTITTSSSSAPVLKLQQVNPIQQVKLAQGIKIQQSGSGGVAGVGGAGVRSVVMEGQQLKLVGGRHVLARILRPAHPPQ